MAIESRLPLARWIPSQLLETDLKNTVLLHITRQQWTCPGDQRLASDLGHDKEWADEAPRASDVGPAEDAAAKGNVQRRHATFEHVHFC